ncbi:MAG: SPFH domain-containing protein [Paludibacter sp.]|jgi:membrane protease subunit (stomatin/prohibitin family)|nr:SPFH domain-containing protein [Paludibacteraceae bacterium]MDX9920572.1 SPFH domain-containing protein [Paludibacter sp.]
MAIIDVVRWSPQGSKVLYAWRFPETNLSTLTQLIVQESQEAVLFSKGQIVGKFGPGKHTLNTENLPVLRNLFGIPFGGKNPFTAEVWFVNRIQTFSIDWAVSKMPIHDPDYNTQLPLVAGGRYGLKVNDAEKFLIKSVGTNTEFSQDDLTDQFFGEFSTKTKSQIAQYVIKHRVGFKYLSAFLDELSDYLKGVLHPFWDNLGLDLLQFNITNIDIDTATEEGRKVANAIATQASMSITGHTWQQEQMFNTANNAVDGLGSGNGGLIGGLMAMNMMGGMGGGGAVGSGMMHPQFNQPDFGGNNQGNASDNAAKEPQMKMVYCSNCSKKYPNTTRFCPHCGDPYNPCPKCGTDNDQNARRCVSCGTPLQSGGGNCPHCNAALIAGATFCGNCGKQTQMGDSCSRCGTVLSPTVKFCPKCGNKR